MNKFLLALIFMVISLNGVNAQSGYLDSSFGSNGILLPADLPLSNFRRSSMELQPDGKILVLNCHKYETAGTKTQIFIHRFMPDGALDPGFGTNGTLTVNQDVLNLGDLSGADIKLLPNGKILAGYFELYAPDSIETRIVRFNQDGTPDALFGVNGVFQQRDFWSAATNVAFLRDIQLQQNGHIVLTYYSNNSHRDNYGFRLLDADGQVLPGYEQIQWANTNNKLEVYVKTLVQPDDKILVGGFLNSYNNNADDKKIIVERFNADATFDTSFADHGIAVLDITPSTDYVSDMVLEPDGHIVVAGSSLDNRLFFAEFLPNGNLDSSFGSSGILLLENTTHFYLKPVMARSEDGHLLVTGIKGYIGSGQETFPSIARFGADGEFDLSFSPDGTVFLPNDGINRTVFWEGMISMPDRRILLCGYAADDSLQQMLMVRFLPELNAAAWYPDADTDGYGSDAGVLYTDQQPQGYVPVGSDCDDQDAGVNPGATEICGNGKDDNCDGISLEDTHAPIARCKQSYKISLDETGSISINPQDLDDGSSDDCGTLQFSASKTVFDCSNLYINFDTLTVTDNAGNHSSCLVVVKIADFVLPVAQCQPVIKPQLDIYGKATISVEDVDAGSYDNCTLSYLRLDKTDFNCSDVLQIQSVTLTAEDIYGNIGTCTTIVKVVDLIGPTVVCPQYSTVGLNAFGIGTIQAENLNLGSFDNCSSNLQYRVDKSTFDCSDLGVPQLVTLTAEDENSNTNICQVEIWVSDKIAPLTVCEESVTLALDNNGTAELSATGLDAGSYDNCGGNLIFTVDKSSFDCSNLGANTVVMEVSDPSGNTAGCPVQVFIEDKIAPTAVCRDTLVMVMNDSGEFILVPSVVDGGSFDNCGGISLQVTPTLFTPEDMGFNDAVLTVTDLSGNQSSCSSMIEIVEIALGAHDPGADWNIQVFPNPTSGIFSLQIDGARRCERAEVFNAAGQLLLQKNQPSPADQFDLSNQAGGCYFLRVQSEGAIRVFKLSLLR